MNEARTPAVALSMPGRGPYLRRTHCCTIRSVLGARLRYMARFAGEFSSYVIVNRTWWIVPVFFLLGLTTLLVVVSQVVAPFTLYSFF